MTAKTYGRPATSRWKPVAICSFTARTSLWKNIRNTTGSGLVFASGLSAKKAVRVQLFTPSGVSIDDFNLVDYSSAAPASYSRCPDGTGPWIYANATPDATNAQSATLVNGLAEPEIDVPDGSDIEQE